MNPKTLAAALEPLAREFVRLEQQFKALSLVPGPAGVGVAQILPVKQEDEYFLEVRLTDGSEHKFALPVANGIKTIEASEDGGFMIVQMLDGTKSTLPLPRGLQGPAGKDATVDVLELAKTIVSEHGDTLRGPQGDKGKQGDAGIGIKEFRADTGKPGIVEVQLTNGQTCTFVLPSGQDGKDGIGIKSISQSEDCTELDFEFDNGQTATVKLPRGQKGEDASPEAVAELLVKAYADKLRGAPGRDAEPAEVAGFLAKDAQFKAAVKGDKGDKGDAGEAPQPAAVAEVLKTSAEFLLAVKGDKGDRGERGDAGTDGLGFNVKTWEPGVYRENTVVQDNLGQVFIALCDTYKDTNDRSQWRRLGTGGFRWCGLREEAKQYEDGDLFIENGTTFLWVQGKGRMFAKRGDKGRDGRDGENGATPVELRLLDNAKTLALALSDGRVLETDMPEAFGQLASSAKVLQAAADYVALLQTTFSDRDKALSWLDTLIAGNDPANVPFRVYRGTWRQDVDYNRGDCVSFNKGLWIAQIPGRRSSMEADQWVRLAGGGGGGATSGVGVRPPKDQTQFQLLSWIPKVSNAATGGSWLDGRLLPASVDTVADLSDIAVLPRDQLALGKLVYVRSMSAFYEYVADPATAKTTLEDWKPLAAGVTYVGRSGNLPTNAADGQMFVIRMELGGEPYYRLVTWDENGGIDLAAVLTGTPPIASGSSAQLTISIPSKAAAALRDDTFTVSLDLSGPAGATMSVHRNIAVQIGDTPTSVAAAVAAAIAAAVPEVTTTATGNVVNFAPLVGWEIESISTTASPTATSRSTWRYINRMSFVKDTRADSDHVTDAKEGDFQSTTEINHRELKVFADGAWQKLFSEDDVKEWIASLSLFEGTAQEPGGSAAGAVTLTNLPNLLAMTAAKELGKVSHYWTWVGAPGTDVIGEAAAQAAAGFDKIPVAVTPALPSTGPAVVSLATPGPLAVGRTVTLYVATSTGSVAVSVDAAGMDGAALAAALAAALTPNTVGVVASQTGSDVTLTPGAGVSIKSVRVQDGGTPVIGDDLNGASLNPGDWLQIANRGTVDAPDLRWVVVGGDLLAKSRGDHLYSLQPWSAGGWERGALTVYQGDIYRATRAVTATDPQPMPTPTPVSITLTAKVGGVLDGSPTAALPTTATPGDSEVASAAGNIAAGGFFGGRPYVIGDRYIYSDNPLFAGTGKTAEGVAFDHGWLFVGKNAPTSPYVVHMDTVPTPWTRIDISGGLKMASTDGDLPATAPSGQVWIVLSSAQAGGKQALYGYDAGASEWQELGGSGGEPLDLSRGQELINIGMPVGAITAFVSVDKIPPGWLLCDGQAIPAEYKELIALCGANVPDLRSQFIRGAKVQSDIWSGGWVKHQDTTRMPRSPFGIGRDGEHTHQSPAVPYGGDNGFAKTWSGGTPNGQIARTLPDGGHTHPITGGDPETAPIHVYMAFIIKATDRFVRGRTK